jgi:hypothetical protein
MVFRLGSIDIIVITNNGEAVDLGQFTSLGVDTTRYRTVAVKSMPYCRLRADRSGSRPRRRRRPMLGDLHPTSSPGSLRRPVWPLGPITDPRAL